MKWTGVLPSVLVLMLFIGTVAFAAPQISAVQANPSAMGFKNYGQYIAAKHVSDSLNISPDTLRTEMVDNQLSLGDAIKKLRPELSSQAMRAEVKNAEAAARKAEAEAKFQPMDHLPTRLSN